MVRNEEQFPGAQVNGTFDLSCQHNPKIFQKMLKILRLTLEFGGKKRSSSATVTWNISLSTHIGYMRL